MLTVADVMTVDVETVGPDASLREAAEILSASHITGLPVTANGRVLGVVTTSDLLDHTSQVPGVPSYESGPSRDFSDLPPVDTARFVADEDEATGAYFTDYWQDAGADVADRFAHSDRPEWDVLEETVVSAVMTPSIVSVAPDTPLREAAQRMLDSDVHRVLVLDGDDLAGILTTIDIVRAVSSEGIGQRT